MRQIIVLTPVKNEAWILDRFLSVTSRFADAILVADQNSTDKSREICAAYNKVTLISNTSATFNEGERQQLLVETARRLWPGNRILLGLDADEILAADSFETEDWKKIADTTSGTVLHFEKPDLIGSTARCLRYRNGFWPLGFVDDNTLHRPSKIHSVRIPCPEGAPRLHVDGIKFLHYGLTRQAAQEAKVRYYAVQENLAATNPVYRRRATYGSYSQKFKSLVNSSEESVDAWFTRWEKSGIDMQTIQKEDFHWQDLEVLRIFAQHGTSRFWLDDIWDFDWEMCRQSALQKGFSGVPTSPIKPAPALANIAGRGMDMLRKCVSKVKQHS